MYMSRFATRQCDFNTRARGSRIIGLVYHARINIKKPYMYMHPWVCRGCQAHPNPRLASAGGPVGIPVAYPGLPDRTGRGRGMDLPIAMARLRLAEWLDRKFGLCNAALYTRYRTIVYTNRIRALC